MLKRWAFGLNRFIFIFHIFVFLLFIFISTIYLVQVSISALTLTRSQFLVHVQASLDGGQQVIYADFPPIVWLLLFKVGALVAAAVMRVFFHHGLLIPLFRTLFHQFVEVLLSMWASLCTCPSTNMPVHLVPILAIDIQGFQELLMLFVSPPALVSVLLCQRGNSPALLAVDIVFHARSLMIAHQFFLVLIIDIHIIFNQYIFLVAGLSVLIF